MRSNEVICLYSSRTKITCVTERRDYNIFQRTGNYISESLCLIWSEDWKTIEGSVIITLLCHPCTRICQAYISSDS
jgi:hypothetical protein